MILKMKNLGPFILLLKWCIVSLESLSQTVYLEYCPKNNNNGDKYQNTVFNPGVKRLEIKINKNKNLRPFI